MALGDVDGDGDLDLVRAGITQGTSLYRNVGGTFAPVPVWREPTEFTRCVALGDVDGDGDLDLVRGNMGQEATLYRNVGGTFEAQPTWTGPVAETRAVALGDVDRDGDLDLVSGNQDLGSTLHLNIGGTFANTPAWTSPPSSTYAIALGDVDGDGILDLVLGNFDQASLLFRGTGAGFAATPAWTGPAERTRGVALGDVDGDGDFDLVRGNLGQGAALTLNAGGTLAASPAWTAPAESTWAVALGDVDADGDLDLMRGNSQRGSTIYLGTGGTFAASPAWSGPVEQTFSVALGDLDGDGDLDLVRGNFEQATTLYRNLTTPFATAAAWTGPTEDTRAVALGDVDGDGDLDLVRGNVGGGTTLYRNAGGTYESTAAWTGRTESTFAVALGDVDGDGDLDLVRGNHDEPATLYRNAGGTFVAAPESIGPPEATFALALGDVDGDGDLDLVRGNLSQRATLYRNDAGTFEAAPAWRGLVEATHAVALADVDADGDLDLVRGNVGEGTTLYLNDGGTFGAAPAWTGPVEQTAGVALGDVDGDGDLDLVRGNRDQGATLYRYAGRGFEDVPAWTGPVEPTAAVALADLDADGDLDLVRGNAGQGVSVYLGRGPAFDLLPAGLVPGTGPGAVALGDLDRDGDQDLVLAPNTAHLHRSPWIAGGGPARLLPNDPAHLRRVATRFVGLSGPNDHRLAFDAVDDESDPLWIVAEYQFAGGRTWLPLTLGTSGPFLTSAAGIRHEVAWDVTRVAFDRRPVTLRLTAFSPPRRVGAVAIQPTYLHDAGRIVPARAALEVSPEALAFPTVTVGDTVVMTLRIATPGTRDLVITGIETPVPELTVEGAAALVIPPDSTRELTARLAPRTPLAGLGPIRVHANDPARPIAEIAVTADVRALDFTTQLLAIADSLPLGQAATVLVTPAPGVRIESGWLLHRTRGVGFFADSSRLVPQGTSFIALVPGVGVTESGLEYYVRVENSGVSRTDPRGAPDSVYFHPVQVPDQLETRALPDARGEFPAGGDIRVLASLGTGAEFVDGMLFYRAGGTAAYDSVEFSPVSTEVSPSALIPGASVGPRGLEYWARVQTRTNLLFDPGGNPRITPRTLRVSVDRLVEPGTHAAGRFRMVSVPLELNLPVTESLEAVLSDQEEFGPPDVTRWRAFRWEPSIAGYLEVTGGTEDERLHPDPGRGFWLIAAAPNAIDTSPVPGLSTSTETPYTVPLGPGWNQVGNPFTFPVAWSQVSAAGSRGTVTLEPPVAWDEANARYRSEDVPVLAPFEGYWVWNPTAETAAMTVPPREAVAVDPTAVAPPRGDGDAAETNAWRLTLGVACGSAEDLRNALGVDPVAAEGRDALDRTEPPAAPGTSVSLYFLDPAGGAGAPRTIDLRPPHVAGGWRWPFDVAHAGTGDAAEEARLAIAGIAALPAGLEGRLVDRTLGSVHDLRATDAYTFVAARRARVATAADARFEILVGTAAWVEDALAGGAETWQTRFSSVAPTPMASAVAVRFELAHAGPAKLEAFDVAGRRVATLLDGTRATGRHELRWTGNGDDGRVLPNGLYLLRLTAGAERAVTRIVVAR